MISLASIEARAGLALRQMIAGPHADKRTAQRFGITVRMAQHLRRGNHWTIRRLIQAAELFGDAFEAALSKPDSDFSYNLEQQDYNRRVEKLKRYVHEYGGQMAKENNTRMASDTGAPRDLAGRGYSHVEQVEPHAGADGADEGAAR